MKVISKNRKRNLQEVIDGSAGTRHIRIDANKTCSPKLRPRMSDTQVKSLRGYDPRDREREKEREKLEAWSVR